MNFALICYFLLYYGVKPVKPISISVVRKTNWWCNRKYFNKNKFWQWKWAEFPTYMCQLSYLLPTVQKEHAIMRDAFCIVLWYSYNSGISNYVNQLLTYGVSKEKLHVILPKDEWAGNCSFERSSTPLSFSVGRTWVWMLSWYNV